jgi:hypothetical protein
MNSDAPKHNFGWMEDFSNGNDWNWQNTFLKRKGIRPSDGYDSYPDDENDTGLSNGGWW